MSISAFYASLYPSGSSSTPKLDATTVSQITQSGFNTVIFSLMHIGRVGLGTQQLGDLVYNNTPDIVATGGVIQTGWTGPAGSDWAFYMSQLKKGGVQKIYISFGGGSPVIDFTTIADSIMQYTDPVKKTGPFIPTSSNLYKNFVALKNYLPMVDGIDIDQEEGNSQSLTDAMIAFGNMAVAVGFREITLVPPYDFYQACYVTAGVAINRYAATKPSPIKGVITRISLQLYGDCTVSYWSSVPRTIGAAGGGANPVMTVGANADGQDPTGINSIFYGYLPFGSVPIAGGFIWEYGYIASNLYCYNQAMLDGLAGKNNWPPASGPCA